MENDPAAKNGHRVSKNQYGIVNAYRNFIPKFIAFCGCASRKTAIDQGVSSRERRVGGQYTDKSVVYVWKGNGVLSICVGVGKTCFRNVLGKFASSARCSEHEEEDANR